MTLIVPTLSACQQETSWNQRLTIVVETPAGGVSGSSVTEVRVVDLNDLAASFGGGVRLETVALEITQAVVTEGVVEQFLFWPELPKQVTFSGRHFYDPARPDPINYLTWKAMKMDSM